MTLNIWDIVEVWTSETDIVWTRKYIWLDPKSNRHITITPREEDNYSSWTSNFICEFHNYIRPVTQDIQVTTTDWKVINLSPEQAKLLDII